MSMTTRGLYVRALSSSLAGQVTNMAAAVAVLWFLNAMLVKEQFAYCMLAMTVSGILAIVASAGFSSVVLYRVSRLDAKAEAVLSRTIAGTALTGAAFCAAH